MTATTMTKTREDPGGLIEYGPAYLAPRIFWDHAQGILGVDDSTMACWFSGWESGGVEHAPVIREVKPDPEWVSWFGFLQAYLMAELGVADGSETDALAMREFFGLLEEEFGVACALGLEEVWSPVSFERIVGWQEDAGLGERWWMVIEQVDGSLGLSAGAQSLFDRLFFEGGCVRRMVLDYPLVEGDEPIYLDALKGFGAPIMRFVGIHHFRSYIQGGDTEQHLLDVYKDWGLTLSELRHAVQYACSHNIDDFDFDLGVEPDAIYYLDE